MRLTLRDDPFAAAKIRVAVERLAAEHGLTAEATFELKVAATEAVANALRHGARDGREVDVMLRRRDGSIEVEVRDPGSFERSDGLDPERGRGLPLMVALADEVEFASTGDGTRVRLRKRIAREALGEALPA